MVLAALLLAALLVYSAPVAAADEPVADTHPASSAPLGMGASAAEAEQHMQKLICKLPAPLA